MYRNLINQPGGLTYRFHGLAINKSVASVNGFFELLLEVCLCSVLSVFEGILGSSIVVLDLVGILSDVVAELIGTSLDLLLKVMV